MAANTYTLISSNVLGSSAANVTFLSIPATYTDLTLRISGRTDTALVYDATGIQFNSDTANNYSRTYLEGTGSAAQSGRGSTQFPALFDQSLAGASSTSSTFGNAEIYIPNYTVAQNKPLGGFGTGENNATASRIATVAALWRNNATISSLIISSGFGGNFVSGSSFYLYGIKNS